MSYLYVSEQGAYIGINGNRFQVKYKDGMIKSIPAETLEVIEVFGKVQLTTQCVAECLKRGVSVIYYSINGAYYGRLVSTTHVNVQRQRKQAAIANDDVFKVDFSRKIISANLLKEIPGLINKKEDNIRVYKIRGQGEVSLFGESIQIHDEEVVII